MILTKAHLSDIQRVKEVTLRFFNVVTSLEDPELYNKNADIIADWLIGLKRANSNYCNVVLWHVMVGGSLDDPRISLEIFDYDGEWSILAKIEEIDKYLDVLEGKS